MRREVEITSTFEIEVDETKFTPEFFAEFSSYMFHMDTVEEAIEHLADLYARGVIDNFSETVEGYGDLKEMGIKFHGTRDAGAFIDNAVEVRLMDPTPPRAKVAP